MRTGYRAAKIASKKAKNSQFLVRFGPPTSGGLWRARRAPRIESVRFEGCPERVAMSGWLRGGVLGANPAPRRVSRKCVSVELPVAGEAFMVCNRGGVCAPAVRLRRAPGGLCTFAHRFSLKTSKSIDFCVFLVGFRHFSGFCIADQPVTKNLFCVLGGHFLLCIIIFLDFGVHHL